MLHSSADDTLSKKYNPSDLAPLSNEIAGMLKQLREWFRNRVLEGRATAPTTPSSQLTGTGNTTWNTDHTALHLLIDGAEYVVAAGADVAVHSGSFLTGLVDGASCIAALVVEVEAGAANVLLVVGTPATTGSQVQPDEAAFAAALSTAGNKGIRVGNVQLNRTGDTTVTEAQDNSARPRPAISQNPNFGNL